MKIALIGYGKMGQAIAPILQERGHQISAIVKNADELLLLDNVYTDCVIEFTNPAAAPENILFCAHRGIPIVVGTTGWYEHFQKICAGIVDGNGALFYATNFSVGVNLFFHINTVLAKLMNRYPEYDVSMREIHHTQKRDAPSGTAITAAEQIISSLERKKNWQLNDADTAETLRIDAERVADVPGTHEVRWQSAIDEIFIRHTANNRQGFALGAVLAAEYLCGRKGIFSMNDLLDLSAHE